MPGNIRDHVEEECGSIRFATSTTSSPRRKATFTALTATGSSSESVLQELIAVAAIAPVQRPSRYVSDGWGYTLPDIPCWLFL